MKIIAAFLCLLLFTSCAVMADDTNSTPRSPAGFSRQDELRGSLRPEREWWDVLHYDLAVEVFPDDRRINGSNTITFKVVKPSMRMQIDLQTPLQLQSATFRGLDVPFVREGNVYWLAMPLGLPVGSEQQIKLTYGGIPTVSKNPPWSGGISWQKDSEGHPFIATSCQGIGASIWWPNKDHGYEEPDRGIDMKFTVPDSLTAVGNGRLINVSDHPARRTKTFHWRVTQPINNYSVNMNIGNYIRLQETINAEAGPLDMDYWVLEHQKADAERQFREGPRTIAAFEHWFGPYPFYEDSYKLVVVPYTGMEHQSSVTYGNGFRNGYGGRDLSGTGVGMKFDFIIVHESGHEWFGNNVSMKDAADMWIHESFTNYSENLFVEYHFSQSEAQDYVIGCRRKVKNDRPIIAAYGVNQSGSGDMYYKGGNMLHTIRHIVNDDEKWRQILRSINQTFRHQTVTTAQIENYLIQQTNEDLQPIFDQYLRQSSLPKLVATRSGKQLIVKYENVINDFRMKTKLLVDGEPQWLTISTTPSTIVLPTEESTFKVDRNWFVFTSSE